MSWISKFIRKNNPVISTFAIEWLKSWINQQIDAIDANDLDHFKRELKQRINQISF
jgi:hypothetical protein